MSTPNGISIKVEKSQEFAGFSQLFKGIAEFPAVVALLETQALEIREIKRELTELMRCARGFGSDGWLDAKGAAAYLGMSAGTFDKYRYLTTPKLKGYKVGGKTLYQRPDLDAFVKLFEMRSNGLA